MDGGDPDAHIQKRPRLDSVNPVGHNGLPPPPHHPHTTQPSRHPAQDPSPLQSRPYPPHSLPPPPGPYSGPPPVHTQYPTHQPSPSLAHSDSRSCRDLPSPSQRAPTHGAVPHPPVTLPARPSSISQESIADYARPSVTPRAAPSDSQSSRTNSIDAKPIHPGMEHGGAPAWPPHEPRPNGSFSNGYPPVVSPPITHEQQYPGIPMHPGQPYTPYVTTPHIGGSAAQSPYAQAQRRKQVRATQACNHCRSRKQKCDEARPCQFCRENNYDCQYKDVPPPKQDRSMQQLQDGVNSISDTLKSFIEGFNAWKYDVESRLPPPHGRDVTLAASSHPSPEENYGPRPSMSESRIPTPIQGRSQMQRVNSMKIESPVVASSTMSPLPATASTPIKQEAVLAAPQPPATPAESVRTDHTNPAGEPTVKARGLQGDHTTPAHQILEDWPSMHSFTGDIPAIENLKRRGYRISDYPMQLEQNRGLVRVWGVGEGHNINDGAQEAGSPESNDSDAPSPAAGTDAPWGTFEAPSPSTLSVGTPGEPEGTVGGMGPDGHLILDTDTLWRLHHSYHVNIHSLHPFLNPSKLRKMVKEFGDLYSSGARPHAGVKRKRSASGYNDTFSPAGDRNAPGFIERSLENAIVLLILALGKVTEYKKPLPAPRPDKANENQVWNCTKASPFSGNGSFSSDDGPDQRPRNIDLLPGMAYFSYATDILGNQQGGNTVAHAQADLLAALYLGQYARVLESWSWINNACRICLVLVKAEMPKISRHMLFNAANPLPQFPAKENYRLNLVKCVYWTCLQLETDILAEMSQLPPSEISKYQEEISYPSGVFEKFPEAMLSESSDHDKTMWIYSSQIHLRVILNEAHNSLYSAGGRRKTPQFDVNNLKEVANAARVHADILQSWRKLLPAELSWVDSEAPATDINMARLRAKFYGGQYMILRPFLFLAVHDIELPPTAPVSGWSSQTSSPAATAESASTPTASFRQRGAFVDLSPHQSEVLRVAHECIDSAIQSTIAFDRVGADPATRYNQYKDTPRERLILTNIFGTLHAQFGNMIVLAAVYRARLKNHLPPDTKLTKTNLSLLFRRTIKILREVAPNSPILKVDADILENVRRQLALE